MKGRFRRLYRSMAIGARSLEIAWHLRASSQSKKNGRRLIILDPGFSQWLGHHGEFNDAIRAEAIGRGWNVLLIVNTKARRISQGVGSERRFFRVYPWRSNKRLLPPSRYLLQDIAQTYCDLKQLSKIDFRPNDRILWHTITTAHLAALVHWYGGLDALRRPQLVAQLQQPVDFFIPIEAGEEPPGWSDRWTVVTKRAYQWAMSRLGAMGQARLTTNSRLLQKHCREIAAPEPTLLGLPIIWNDEPLPSVRRKGVFRIAFLGGARPEKGFELLPSAIADLLHHHSDVEFFIQCPGSRSAQDVVNRLVAMGPRVAILNDVVSRDRFLTLLREADCVITPYDPARYHLRTSGIFIEALGAGRPVVTTAGSWMASVIHEHGLPPLLMDRFDASSLISAVRDFLKAPDRYRAAYERVAPEVRAAHNPLRVLDQIEALF